MKNFLIKNRGFGIMEVVIGASIISLSLFGILSVAKNSLRVSEHSLKEAQANFLIDEGAEAMRSLRDLSWNNISSLSTSTVYYLTFATGTSAKFSTTTLNNYIDSIFERSISVSNVYRDSGDKISSSGILDGGTKKIRVNVSWKNRMATTTKYVDLYLSDI